MMIDVRQDRRESWFDPSGSRMLAARLADKLGRRVKGEEGVFVTLTYARESWESGRQLYRSASDDRHVRRFIEDLGSLLGQNLTGRWLCKMEFQQGGYVHWHLLILGVKFIEHAMLEKAWGWGYVFINRMTPGRVRYLAKYVAKPGSVPPWLLLEPVRSVKFIRVSPGFWDALNEKKRQRSEPSQEARERMRIPFFVPVGLAMQRAEHRTQVVDDRGRRARVHLQVGTLVSSAMAAGARTAGAGGRGWLRLMGVDLAWVRKAGRAAVAAGDAAPPFHLIETGEPPWWLIEALTWKEVA